MLTSNKVSGCGVVGVVDYSLAHSLQIHVLHEDWSNESVHLITSISVEDINNIGVDSNLPVYCTLVSENERDGKNAGKSMTVKETMRRNMDF